MEAKEKNIKKQTNPQAPLPKLSKSFRETGSAFILFQQL